MRGCTHTKSYSCHLSYLNTCVLLLVGYFHYNVANLDYFHTAPVEFLTISSRFAQFDNGIHLLQIQLKSQTNLQVLLMKNNNIMDTKLHLECNILRWCCKLLSVLIHRNIFNRLIFVTTLQLHVLIKARDTVICNSSGEILLKLNKHWTIFTYCRTLKYNDALSTSEVTECNLHTLCIQ